MDKSGFLKVVNNLKSTTIKHSPEILTGIGITGMITTTIMAVKATPKALDIMADVKAIHAEDTDRKAFAKDVLTKVAPIYLPAVIVCFLSTGCLIGASSVNLRRNAALATAYTLSETALREYQDKVVETIGDKKEQHIRDEIAKDRVERNPVSKQEVLVTAKGETLCYDSLSGRYFKSDMEVLKRATNELNRRMLSEDYISLNDFYDEIGLSYTKIGEDIGWRVDKGFIELVFSSQLASDGTPCLVLDYQVAPYYDYDR